MVVIKVSSSRTASAVMARYEREAADWRRQHLGASVVGKSRCGRRLWYDFRWASARLWEGRMLRLLERGHREEQWVVDDLRRIGVRVEDRDPETGEQWRCSMLGGHFGGSADAVVLGIPEAPRTWHLLEVKTLNKKRWEDLARRGVAAANPDHHAQMQVYMGGLELDRAVYVGVCKDDDRWHVERVRRDREAFAAIEHSARSAIFSPEPLSRVSDDPSWHECRLCQHRPHCHLGQVSVLERNCRTCASSTPRDDGSWWCEAHARALSVDDQKAGCAEHLFVPAMLEPLVAVDGCDDLGRRHVTYRVPGGGIAVDSGLRLRGQHP